jgi:PelA/Pel-15E family pectate lyase
MRLPYLIVFSLFIYSNIVYSQNITVAADGSGNFKSIQEAINSLPDSAAMMRTIFIKKGIYREKIWISKHNICLKGEKNAQFGKDWQTINARNNKNTEGVYIIFPEAREIFRCTAPDDWGSATMNIRAKDVTLENLIVVNSFGFEAKGDSVFMCDGKAKVTRKDGHQFALRCMPVTQRLTVINCNFHSWGGDTVSPWDVDNGTFYFKNCTMEGAVDFYCPRGWAYAEGCYFICHNNNAAIWHDGTGTENAKTVLKNCTFVGDKGYKLGRFHRDAQFYLINCTFSKDMADADIYQVRKDTNLVWGKRVNYFNCHTESGDFAWHKNNIDKKTAKLINRDWTLKERWLMPAIVKNKSDYGLPTVANAPTPPPAPQRGIDVSTTSISGGQKGNDASTISPSGGQGGKIPPLAAGGEDPIAENMLIAQRNDGGWAKSLDGKIQPPPYDKEWDNAYKAAINDDKGRNDATIDNNATTREIQHLVKAYNTTKNEKYKEAAEKGIAYLLKMQYANGGFPQFFPDTSGYRKHITFNDNAMIHVLEVLKDITENNAPFDNIGSIYKEKAKNAVERGIDCILKTQIKVNGQLTIWCAQHDYKTLAPTKARAYELPSFSGNESVGILEFLMQLKKPTPSVSEAIRSGVHFLESIKLKGIKVDYIKNGQDNKPDRVVVNDPKAPPIWARFYDLDTKKPYFCGRDGIKKATLAEIEQERRGGYAWYGDWATKLIEKDFPKWIKVHGMPSMKGITGKVDTGYTNWKAYNDVKKTHPNISFAEEKQTPLSAGSTITQGVTVLEQKNIVYNNIGERKLLLDAFVPTEKSNTQRPAILIIHGGGWRTGNRAQHHALAQRLASMGYVCFTPEYRLSTEALFPAGVHDLKAALRYIRANAAQYRIDTNRIATLGFSAGGQLSALLGTTGDNPKLEGISGNIGHATKVNAAIDMDGILAFIHPDSGEGDDSKNTSAATYWFGYSKIENPELWKSGSALTYVNDKTPPTLFINSSVARMHAGREDYIAILNKHNIYSEVHTFEDAPHSFPQFHPWFEPMVGYIDGFLKRVFK